MPSPLALAGVTAYPGVMTQPASLPDTVKSLLPARTVLKLSGTDIRPFLQGLITQDIEKLTPCTAIYSALLTPQGKFLYDFFLIEHQHAIWIDTDESFADALLKKLKLYKLRADVTIENMCGDWAVGAVWPGSDEAELGRLMGIGAGDSPAIAYTDPRNQDLGLRLLAPTEDMPAALANFEAALADETAHQDHELAFAVPRSAIDLCPEDIFPLDANLDALNGIDYKKGCFVGQEVSSRMWRKGSIRKRLWSAQIQGTPGAPLVPGTPVKMSDSTIGEISSANGNTALIRLRLDRYEKADGDILSQGVKLSLTQPSYLDS